MVGVPVGAATTILPLTTTTTSIATAIFRAVIELTAVTATRSTRNAAQTEVSGSTIRSIGVALHILTVRPQISSAEQRAVILYNSARRVLDKTRADKLAIEAELRPAT